jgi:GT2 family glycosyltransferase
LLFVDADDVVCPVYLSAMHRALQEASLIAARQQLVGTTANSLLVPEPPPDRLKEAYGFWPSAGGALGIRTVDFERLNGFDESLLAGEDIDFWWRARLASISMDLEPDAVIEIHHHAGLRGSFRRGRSHGLAAPKLYRKYRGHGMPRRGWHAVIRFYGGLFARLPRMRNKADLDAWMFLAGYRVGLVEGCIRQRVLYL